MFAVTAPDRYQPNYPRFACFLMLNGFPGDLKSFVFNPKMGKRRLIYEKNFSQIYVYSAGRFHGFDFCIV